MRGIIHTSESEVSEMAKNDKTENKVKKADKKTGKKCGALVAFLALAAMVCGCAQTGAQPSRSQTLNNDFKDCIVIVAGQATVSNTTVVANSEDGLQPVELFTQTMKNEGSEQNTPTASPTQTTRIDPKTDVNTTGGRTAGVLESIVGAFGTWLTTPSGKDAVKAADASAASTAGGSTCTDGNCSPSGSCPSGNCSEGTCTDCQLK